MNVDALFLREISKLKRRISIRLVQRVLLWGFIFFLSSYTLVNIIAKAGRSGSNPYGIWVFILMVISVIAAIAVATSEKADFQSFLIDVDSRLQFRDSISTAYEYHRSGIKSVFLDLLMMDATVKLRRLSPRQIFPAKFSKLHFALMLVLITAGALFFSYYSTSVFTPVPADRKKIEKARTLVRDFVRSHVATKRLKDARDNSLIAGNISQLRKTLNDPTITRDQLLGELNRQLKEIQAKQTNLAAGLESRLNDARILNTPIQEFPDSGTLNASKLAKLKKILKQALNNRIPDDIQQDMESLQEVIGMQEFLSQIIDEFHESYSGPQEFAETGRNQSSGSASPGDYRKESEDPDSPATGEDIAGEKESRGADIPGRSRPDSSLADDIDMPDGTGLPHETSPRAGKAKSGAKEKPASQIKEAPGPGIQDKVRSAQVKQYLIRIRSQTAPGESRLKAEEIVREYQREVEAILQKEEIPLNYREYIKKYFLSIGIETSDSLK